jgi:hypothetical protein
MKFKQFLSFLKLLLNDNSFLLLVNTQRNIYLMFNIYFHLIARSYSFITSQKNDYTTISLFTDKVESREETC